MPTLDELREALRLLANKLPPYEYAPELVHVLAKIADAEADRAAQQQRIAALTAALEPFAELWQMWLDSSMYDGETMGAFPDWLYDESVVKVEHDVRRAHDLLHAGECT